ncbi:putative C6 transcription factor [Aspergillus steynii IBT 23096]|uniref:Putative C6 transcription factor n=1 Tax=Aspergillus steynii IBT 23096 TaxID=1392250 RepID=A0A2I2GJV6_9EURO|nr:putative C6 transcription factor [Aspergillus steynii IBT 23096]PLB53164.1 putative C6 transcription factor [Aspergillus steynii IBT 23096]
MADTSAQSAALRRNGTLQSCEPCRKSKLRCDHGRPVCGRCKSKNMIKACFYHPAPMTKRTVSSRASPIPATGRLISQSSSTASSPGSAIDGARLRATVESPSTLPGYLGSTSFSAVLAEHPSGLLFELPASNVASGSPRFVDPIRVQSGVDILKLLSELPICDSLIRKFYTRSLCVVIPVAMIEAIVQSVRGILGSLDFTGAMDGQIQDLTHQIFQNTSRSLTVNSAMNVEDYCALFTGRNLRWEAIGIIFATSGIALMSTPDTDPDVVQVAPDGQARDRLRTQIVDASTACLGFCDQAASASELLGLCQYNDVMLRTQQFGDSSYQAWRRLGDLSATVYAAGVHQDGQNDDRPFFLRQWRRIFFASAFYADKCIATFVGRPPLLNYRYCTLTPPLDLNEDILIAGGDNLTRAISELDINGWGSRSNIYRAGVIRLRFLLAAFREEALEIALGTYDHWDLAQKSNQIIEKARATWEAAPTHLRFDVQGNDSDPEAFSASFTVLNMYLDYLYSIFLLQRALVKRTNTGQEALLETSRRVLSLIITVTADRDPVMDMSRHYSWIVLYYGLPSASVLTLELLHQTQDGGPSTIVLPRAELIRNLSVFVSCLSWISRPSHGNYQTCKEVEKKLSHILDQILDPQPIQQDIFNDATSGLYNFLDWYNPGNWDFNSEYLPSTDGFVL